MSFNPISDWAPDMQKRSSDASLLKLEEVSKGKRICKYCIKR